jgi:hypothetical protein
MRESDPSIPETPSDLSPTRIAEIAGKIERQRFSRETVSPWVKRGAWIGAGIGGLSGAALWFFHWTNRPERNAFFEYAIFGLGILGSILGSLISGVIVGIIKPVIAAIFWDTERYEREYGSDRPPLPNRRMP